MVVVSLGTKGISASWTDGGNPIKPPPKGLEPIGDSGWYKSPDDLLPGDRLYCEYNPGSPVCGGNPFTNQGVGIDAEINVDPCGFSTRLSGAIAFVKVPEIQLTYRKAGACRREYEKPPEAIPPPPAPAGYDKPANTPIPSGFGQNERVAAGFTSHAYGYSQTWNKQTQKYDLNTYDSSCSCSGINVSGTYLFDGYQHLYQPPQAALAKCEFTFYSTSYDGKLDATYTQVSDTPAIYAIDSRQEKVVRTLNPLTYRDCYRAEHNPNQDLADLYEGKFGDIFIGRTGEPYYYYQEYEITDTSTGVVHTNVICDIIVYDIAFCIRKPSDTKRNPPSFPLAPDRDCCMQCCFSAPSSQQNNNDSCCKEVLEIVKRIDKNLGTYPGKVTIFDSNEDSEGAQSKVIEFSTVAQGFSRAIERIEKISKIIGIDLLPVTVPKTIVEPINDNFFKVAWDFITPDATEKIENLFEWHVWNLKQMSALIGDFQRYVEIEDKTETITKEDGTQETKTTTKKIALPDIATSLVELVKNQIVLHREVGLTLDVCMKILVSSCNTKQEVAKVYAELSEIVDWLDYPTREKSLEVPIQISIPPEGASDADQQDIHKFLQPGTTHIKYNDWDGTNSFKDFMIHLATLMSRNARG